MLQIRNSNVSKGVHSVLHHLDRLHPLIEDISHQPATDDADNNLQVKFDIALQWNNAAAKLPAHELKINETNRKRMWLAIV